MNKHIADAFRYLQMTALELYKHTPAEYLAMRNGAVEQVYDEMERYASLAIMIGNAVNSRKKIKSGDLFKRPTGDIPTKKTLEDIRKKQEDTLKWLAQFEEFKDKV